MLISALFLLCPLRLPGHALFGFTPLPEHEFRGYTRELPGKDRCIPGIIDLSGEGTRRGGGAPTAALM